MKVPFFHCQGNHESTDEQENCAVKINGSSGITFQNSKQWEKQHGQQRSRKQRDGIGYPPRRH